LGIVTLLIGYKIVKRVTMAIGSCVTTAILIIVVFLMIYFLGRI